MNVEVIVRVDGREVASVEQVPQTSDALELDEQTEWLKDRLGQVVREVGFGHLADELRRPCCGGRPLENQGR
jgi:hypothetical protein